ncbi:MAG TPA: HAMP domain-containing sensor histidine kinase [Acidimicrobiales bacterium]|nr:HAMP domain-containing sensor histidine kinase [Acidimicrobiales bacterium]
MRSRLTIAILCVVAATLLLTSAGSYVLVRRAANSTAQQELVSQAQAVSQTLSGGAPLTGVGLKRELRVIKDAGDFSGIRLVRLFPDGTVKTALPPGIDVSQLHVTSLLAGNQVTGKSGNLIYSAIPTPVRTATRFTPVLVITRVARNPANGIRYFLFVAAGVLVLAAVVAWALGRRFSRPLEAAVGATRRIADGDLDVTVLTAKRDDPEFRQLAEAINAMAAGLSRARDQERQFLLSVSHELRTPLTSIRGYADAVADGATDDIHGAVTVIGTEARQLDRLVQDLLDLAKLDADRFSLRLEVVDCAAVIGHVVEGLRPRALANAVELDAVLSEPDGLVVLADKDRLGQMMGNLAENAARFAASRITVGAGWFESSVALWVEDDGPGISPDEMPRVFERHFSSDRSSPGRHGTGLGLAIVSELASAMGATVQVHSPVSSGRGTRFVVLFAPADGRAIEGRSVEGRSVESRSVEGQSAEEQSAHVHPGQSAHMHPTERRSARDDQPTSPQPPSPQPTSGSGLASAPTSTE